MDGTKDDEVNTMSHISSFEKLPAELRIQIYECIFVAPAPIELRQKSYWVGNDRKIRVEGAIRTSNLPDSNFFIRHFEHRVKLATHALRLNKRIYAEALPVLYGENTFAFNNGEPLSRFLQMKPSTQHLQHLKLSLFYNLDLNLDLLSLILVNASIRTLKVCIDPEPISEGWYKRRLWSLIEGVLECGADEGEKRELLATVRFGVWYDNTVTHQDESALLAELGTCLEKKQL